MERTPSPATDYGLDAPRVVQRLGVYGLVALGVGQALYFGLRGTAPVLARSLLQAGIWTGGCLLLTVAVMIWSSRVGKLRLRDRLLDMISWRGDEFVLDAGCGRGLALIGAAKRLTRGRAIGIDFWSQTDLADNQPERTIENVRAEGVADKVEIRTGDIRELPFEQGTFDVVVTISVVHNMENAVDRRRALDEMLRILKPGGALLIYDVFKANEYIQVLGELGAKDIRTSGWLFYWLVPGRRISCRA